MMRNSTLRFIGRGAAAYFGVGMLAVFALRAGAAESLRLVNVDAPRTMIDSKGDAWVPAWAADGAIYTPSCDTSGFRGKKSNNIMFSRVEGDDIQELKGTTVNLMDEYGKEGLEDAEGCNWKTGGCYVVDGVIYCVVSQHIYGEKTGDPGMRQTAGNASIIKSNDGGKTWTRSVAENHERPMFPGRRFATPFFVEYGQDGKAAVDNGDKYIYAISNNGFWDNGDNQILGRVARSKIADLHGTDWQYYQGGDGMEDAAWTPDMHKSQMIVNAPGKLGMTGAAYVPGLNRYLMIAWYYPAGGGMIPNASVTTVWDFYEASKPWGPWTKFGSKEWNPQGYYDPVIFPKFSSADGRQLFAMTAGNWKNKKVYKLTVVPFQVEPPEKP
jgi:hypothetical protein